MLVTACGDCREGVLRVICLDHGTSQQALFGHVTRKIGGCDAPLTDLERQIGVQVVDGARPLGRTTLGNGASGALRQARLFNDERATARGAHPPDAVRAGDSV
jgi:hypothetical protein